MGSCKLFGILLIEPRDRIPENISEKDEPSIPINWYFHGNGRPAGADLVVSKISECVKEKGLNINLKLNCLDYGSYVEEVKNMAAADEEFDICFTASGGSTIRKWRITVLMLISLKLELKTFYIQVCPAI